VKKPLAELIGTYLLVFIGTCAAVSTLSTCNGRLDSGGIATIGLAFGAALVAIAYAFGPISGAHVNPAVTLGMLLAGKISARDATKYWGAQFAGGVLAALTLQAGFGDVAERYDFGADSPGPRFGIIGALTFEIVSTMLFFLVIYGVAVSKRGAGGFAGLPIGIYLAASHFAGIPISGSSLNPARDFGPALLAGGDTLTGVWLYFAGPLLGAVLGGMIARHIHEGDA
jgi:aquaporin Z